MVIFSVAMFLKLSDRLCIDTQMSDVSTVVSSSDDKCIVVPLEDSVRRTNDQTKNRGEFFATEETCTCAEPLVVMLPVATSRVRFGRL